MKIESVISWPNIHIVQMRCIYGSSPSRALILASLTYDHQLEVRVEISCKILNALYINSHDLSWPRRIWGNIVSPLSHHSVWPCFASLGSILELEPSKDCLTFSYFSLQLFVTVINVKTCLSCSFLTKCLKIFKDLPNLKKEGYPQQSSCQIYSWQGQAQRN